MKLDYNIIWVEDKIETRPFEVLIKNISQYLTDQFFKVNIQTAEDFNEFKLKFDKYGNFDLVITDLSLNDSRGDEVINFVRMDKNVLTEVFFYSANDLNQVDLANSSRITFYQLNGPNLHKELENKIVELISLTIAKFQHIIAMRGMIMHETSSLDVVMQDILTNIVNERDSEKKIEIIKEKYKESSEELVDAIFKIDVIQVLLTKVGATHRWRALMRNLSKGQLKSILNDYEKEVILLRNQFAHAVLDEERQVFKTKNGIEFNSDNCKKIRKDIIKHIENLHQLKEKLNK